MIRARALAIAPWIVFALSGPARSDTKSDFFMATLENGVTLSFALVRTGGAQSGSAIGEAVFPRSTYVSRVLLDETNGTYFGYQLEVKRSDKQLKAEIKPLGSNIQKELESRLNCPRCRRPKLLEPSAPRSHTPLALSSGDVFTLELLANPTTGEKIVDVVKVDTQPFPAESMQRIADRIREALKVTQFADTFAARGAYDKAVTEYRRVLDLNPKDVATRNKLGICLQHLNNADAAAEQYRQAIRINPNYAEVWNNLGSIAHSRGDYKQAVKHYQKATALKPSFATAYRNMGAALLALDRFEEGVKAYQAAFRLDPTILEGTPNRGIAAAGVSLSDQYFYFAKVCAADGQIEAALSFLKKAKAAGFKNFNKVNNDPDFKAVVRDSRYQQIVAPDATKK